MAQDEVETTPRPTGSGRIALAALGGGMSVILLAGGAMAIAGAASADNADPTPAPAAPQAPPAPGGPGALLGGMGLAGLGGGIGSAGVPLHGTAVVKTADGTYQTLAGQHGEVTAVSATSLSVTSDDGYSMTYVVDGDTRVNGPDGTIADIEAGEDVIVVAEVEGATQTATRVFEPGTLAKLWQDHNPPTLGKGLLQQLQKSPLLKALERNPMLKKLRKEWLQHPRPQASPSPAGTGAAA